MRALHYDFQFCSVCLLGGNYQLHNNKSGLVVQLIGAFYRIDPPTPPLPSQFHSLTKQGLNKLNEFINWFFDQAEKYEIAIKSI